MGSLQFRLPNVKKPGREMWVETSLASALGHVSERQKSSKAKHHGDTEAQGLQCLVFRSVRLVAHSNCFMLNAAAILLLRVSVTPWFNSTYAVFKNGKNGEKR
jgi:hypothetical protein